MTAPVGTSSTSTDISAVGACPINPVIEIVFSRWTTPILWTLQKQGPQRFNEIRRHLGTVTPKVLTQRLRQLERDGLVQREYFAEVPPRAEYAITELGLSLTPAFRVLASWTGSNIHLVEEARQQYDLSGRPRVA